MGIGSVVKNVQHIAQGTTNVISKGTGSIIGGTVGIGKRVLNSGGGAIKEAMSEFSAGLKTAYGLTSGNTARAAKESEKLHKKAVQNATDAAFEFKTDMNRVSNVRNADFVGPHPKDALDNAKIVQTLDNAKNPNFVGPHVADDELRSMKRAVDSVNPDFIGPMPVAKEMAESGAGFWSGLGNAIQEHPYVAAGIAGGIGIAGGALLFDDDDYE